MSELICRKSMMRCQTPGMCSPHGGCGHSVLLDTDVRYSNISAGPAVPVADWTDERKLALTTALKLVVAEEENANLKAENEKLLKLLSRMVDQHVPLTELEGVPGWGRVVELVEVTAQRDALKAENAHLKKQEIEVRAETERQAAQFKEWQASHHANYVAAADERDQLKAECEGLRKQVADLWPVKRPILEQAPSLKCIACGGYHYGMGSLPCPKMGAVACGVMGKGEQS